MRFFPAVPPGRWPAVWITLLLVLLPLVPGGVLAYEGWAAATMRYEVDAGTVRIRYALSSVSLLRQEIRAARLVTEPPPRLRKVWGAGAPGIRHGQFQSPETGPLALYATVLPGHLVLLETARGLVGLTPADPAGFQAALATAPPGLTVFPAAPGGAAVWTLGGLAALLTLSLAFLALALLLALRRPGYLLGDGRLVARFGWFRSTIPLGQITKVRQIPAPRRGLRTFGAGMPGLLLGGYRYRETGPITLYATSTKAGLVVVEAGRRRYGFTPADPENFVTALKQELQARGGAGQTP